MFVIDNNTLQNRLLTPEVGGVWRSDTELTIKSAHDFCIDIKHCDVYYANVPGKHFSYCNAELKEGYSFAPKSTKIGRSLQNWLDVTPDISCNPIQQKQQLLHRNGHRVETIPLWHSLTRYKHCSLHEGNMLLNCMKSSVSTKHNDLQRLSTSWTGMQCVCVFNLSTKG